MSVVLQVRVNAGAPSTGRVVALEGDTIQLTAASFAGWRTSVARWTIYDFPPTFSCPAGWSTDATSGFYYYDGNTDPPSFTIPANQWGKYQLKLQAQDGDSRTTDSSTGIVVESALGIAGGICADEDDAFGGDREKWTYDIKRDIRLLSDTITSGGVSNIQGAVIDIGTEAANDAINVGNGSDSTIVVDGADLTLRANAITVDTDNGSSFGITGTAGNVNFASTDSFNFAPGGDLLAAATNITLDAAGDLGIESDSQISVTTTGPLSFTAGDTIAFEGVSGPQEINFGAASTWTLRQSPSSSGAGRTFTTRGQKGQAGFVGGDYVIGPGDGGTPGTNAPGNLRVVLGTPVSNTTGIFYLERESGTKILSVYEIASGTTGIYGGAIGTSDLHVQGTRVTLASTSNAMRLRHPAGSSISLQEASTEVCRIECDADGATLGTTTIKLNAPTANVSPELRLNADTIQLVTAKQIAASAIEIAFGAAGGTASGLIRGSTIGIESPTQISQQVGTSGSIFQIGGIHRQRLTSTTNGHQLEDAGGNVFKHTRIGSAQITTATTTYAITFATTSNRTYKVKAHYTVANQTDSQGATYEMEWSCKNVAGVISNIGASATAVLTREDAGQTGLGPVLTSSGTNILVGLISDSADTLVLRCVLEVWESVLA